MRDSWRAANRLSCLRNIVHDAPLSLGIYDGHTETRRERPLNTEGWIDGPIGAQSQGARAQGAWLFDCCTGSYTLWRAHVSIGVLCRIRD